MLSKADIQMTYPGRIPYAARNIRLAKEAMRLLWNEKLGERGLPPCEDRSSSCKFAALLARELFGGSLAGNEDHVFVHKGRDVLDLNREQTDVLLMGEWAHQSQIVRLLHPDYRRALHSCIPRVTRWVDWVLAHPELEPAKASFVPDEACTL